MQQTDIEVALLTSIAEDLLGIKIKTVTQVGGGRNSRVHRLLSEQSHVYALKSYFQHAADKRQRMNTEFSSLSFLWENGIENIPKPIACSPEHNVAIYEWIDGERIATDSIDSKAVGDASSFLVGLQNLRHLPEARRFQAASEAFFSGQALADNLQKRLQPLLSCAGHEDLQIFLSRDFAPFYSNTVAWINRRTGPAFKSELEEDRRILSPSDFGFHNALRYEQRGICFLDFEYFGWDDPSKTIADFLLHPAMPLEHHLKQQFVRDMVKDLSLDADAVERIKTYYPLFGLKWCLILLNEFLPNEMMRRQFASASYDSAARQTEQLTKARAMLNRVVTEYECFPYLN